MRRIIPLINGSKWALQLIPIVVEVIAGNPNLSRREKRKLLRERFLQAFVQKSSSGWVTAQGEVLKEEATLLKRLNWTWLDQFAIPMCSNLRIIVLTKDNYRLSTHGKRLAKRLAQPSFEDMLRNVIIHVDSESWGVINILRKSPLNISSLREKLEQRGVLVRKDEHLRKYISFLEVIGLVKEQVSKPVVVYRIDKERYKHCKKLMKYRRYEDVDNPKFMETLYKVYRERTRTGHSSFVDIDDLRPSVNRALKWPEPYFTRRLEEIPLRVGKFQLLFSQAAFPKERIGVERKGRYFNYLSIYEREKRGRKR